MQIYELGTVIKGVKVIFYERFTTKKPLLIKTKAFCSNFIKTIL